MPKPALCSGCQEPSAAKMAGFYWAWTWPTGDRRAYKQLLDFECSTTALRRIVRSQKEQPECNECGGKTDPQAGEVLVWTTYYLPGKDRADACLVFHPACFEQVAQQFVHNAVRLPERRVGGGGSPAPHPGRPQNAWAMPSLDTA